MSDNFDEQQSTAEYYDLKYEDIRKYKRTNPFSGQSEMLTNEEAILYDQIKMAEVNEDYKTMRAGLSKFMKLNAGAYMTLLD